MMTLIKKDNMLFLDNKPFKWAMSLESLQKAKRTWTKDPSMKEPILMDIYNHFLKSLSKHIGRQITIEEIMTGLEKGQI